MAKLEIDVKRIELLRSYLGQIAEVRISKDELVKVGIVIGVAENDEAILSIYFPPKQEMSFDDERADYRVYELKPERADIAPSPHIHNHDELGRWYDQDPHIAFRAPVLNEYNEVTL